MAGPLVAYAQIIEPDAETCPETVGDEIEDWENAALHQSMMSKSCHLHRSEKLSVNTSGDADIAHALYHSPMAGESIRKTSLWPTLKDHWQTVLKPDRGSVQMQAALSQMQDDKSFSTAVS
ncbi:hypothetical protein [Litorimonas sp. WD9-15]|uniref:hypothetical protein n=1 Tax=Litorimonas sp. WD9-15 TaxID=3418716 RepID=UPI003D044DC3